MNYQNNHEIIFCIAFLICGIILGVISTILFLTFTQNTEILSNYELYDLGKKLSKNNIDGVCWDWTMFYKSEMEKRNIEYLQVTIPVSNKKINNTIYLEGHTFLIAYNENGYCKFDQKNINCFVYEKS